MRGISREKKQFLTANFPTRPEEEHLWMYSYWDLADEMGWALLGFVLAVFLWFWPEWHEWSTEAQRYMHIAAAASLFIPLGYFLVVFFMFLFKRQFDRYRITPTQFIVERGFFVRRTFTYDLSDINQVNTSQTLWGRVVGVGTVILVWKGNIGGKPSTIRIRGVSKFKEMRDTIDYYRNYYRLVRCNALISA